MTGASIPQSLRYQSPGIGRGFFVPAFATSSMHHS
jgi:hypothetical protein